MTKQAHTPEPQDLEYICKRIQAMAIHDSEVNRSKIRARIDYSAAPGPIKCKCPPLHHYYGVLCDVRGCGCCEKWDRSNDA